MNIPINDFLGARNGGVQVEESWSKDLPVETGVNAPIVDEFVRDDKFLDDAVKSTQKLREKRFEEIKPGPIAGAQHADQTIAPLNRKFLFFSVNAESKSLVYVGTVQIEAELEARFKKDVSGRFFRECVKKEFPDRTDYFDIVCFQEGFTLKDVADAIEFMNE